MRIACLTMQKNEDLLLEPWIRYHAYLFGIDNLFILDNGSFSPPVLALLSRFEAIGLNVDRRHAAPKDFENKGRIVGKMIMEFKETNRYDAVFALDCDEFVAVTAEQGVSCLRKDILSYLSTVYRAETMVRVGHCLDNRPGFADIFRFVPFRKSFIPVPPFKSVDHGFHEPKSLDDAPAIRSRIIFIHMHFKPYDIIKLNARDKLAPFVNVDNADEFSTFSGVGIHLKRYFSMTADEYYADIGNYKYPLVKYTGLMEVLGTLMPMNEFLAIWCTRPVSLIRSGLGRDIAELPGPYLESAYLDANPDVRKDGMDPTVHYCLFGFREGRPLKIDTTSPQDRLSASAV